ncbi:terpene cyclase/mutase family protein [Luteolibacter pohnpeiensis]|uniref:Terpene cyclase/mutase family protein n=1 Tax=Luteolibacter pohnpeiensis TaxID=454153 RepID=A0A934VVQ5_9BACT|nr:prenyltransferase/squalene oxidase repeat-containing protein [Luteolibacter pohnpeiensis]MBK1883807.1 terpene cyclase/mutase family protein [Luteolibacter pohnpeiensis]
MPGRQDDVIPPQVELIYGRGLEYLAKSQNDRGCWNDNTGTEPGVVGLCVAAFLAHGEDPNTGPYAGVIGKALEYILSEQNQTNGYIGNNMYSHCFATKALAESYGMVDNPKIAPALRKAIDLILSAQKRNNFKAWRYTPESKDADTTVTGGQMVTLFAARNAGLEVPDEAIKNGLAFLNKCRTDDGSIGYTSAIGGKPSLTAIGVLCHCLAKEPVTKGYEKSLSFLKKNLEFRDRYYPYYYEYYMSQALFHASDEAWQEWNASNIRYMGALQTRDGSFPGNQGEAFSTAGALLSLALNYRYLPIYEK